MSKKINLECKLKFFAAPDDEEGGERVPTFEMVAYNGGKMDVGFGFVVLDLDGMTWTDKSRPILLEHNRGLRLGRTTSIEIVEGALIVKGELGGTSQEARDVIADSVAGFPFQASVGVQCDIESAQEIDEDSELRINGEMHEGPLTVYHKSELKEISFVALGADDSTEVSVAASAATAHFESENEEKKMSDNEVEVVDGVADIRAAQAGEINRCASIRAACGDNLELAAKHIEAGSTAETAKIEALEAVIEAKAVESPHVSRGATAPVVDDVALSAAALKFGGVSDSVIAKTFGDEVASTVKPMALGEMVLRCAARAGVHGYSSKDTQTIEAAFSTIGGLSGILGNAANKVLLAAYDTGETIIDRLAARQTVSDFKQTSQYRLTLSGDYKEVGPSGELKHTDVVSEAMYAQAKTRGVVLTLTREMQFNDDMGAFLNLFADLARTADRARERVGLGAFIDAVSFWTTANKNYVTGATTALSSASLSKAIETLSLQTDKSDQPIGIRGKYLVVPTALEATAKQLMASMTITGASDGDVNIHAGAFEVLSSPLLQAGTATATSAKAWYLCADPAVAPVVTMSYLNGNVAPTIEQVELQGAQLGVQFRAYSDFGANSSDFRGGVKMKGEA